MRQQKVPPRAEIESPLVLRLRPSVELTDDQLLELSSLNSDLRLERTAEGDLEIMPPTGGETSNRNAGLVSQVWLWAERDGTGFATDSSGGFRLPNGAVRAPDAAWVRRERLTDLTAEQKQKFLPLCPDFVIELRSPPTRCPRSKPRCASTSRTGRGWAGSLTPRSAKSTSIARRLPSKSWTTRGAPLATPFCPASYWTCAGSGNPASRRGRRA